MIDLIYFYVNWIDDIVMHEFEVWMADPMFHVPFTTREEIIGDHNLFGIEDRENRLDCPPLDSAKMADT